MHLKPSHFAHVLVAAVVGSAAAMAGYSATQPQEHQEGEHQPQEAGAPGGEDMQAAMEAWAASMTPGKPHEYLKQFEGTWNTTMRVYWDPSSPPIESKGTTTYTMILDGRFLEQEFKGQMQMPGEDGQMQSAPFEGRGLMGYNNTRKQYVGTWVDNFTTAILYMTGDVSQDGKTLTMFAEMDEPMTGEIGKTVKYTTRIESPDKHVFEAWEVSYGEPFKVFEIEYQRAE